MRNARLGSALAKAGAVLVASVFVALVLAQGVARPLQWEMPEGYQGWILAQFGDSSCPPLRTDGIFEVIRVSADGRACTSSDIRRGWHYARYVYATPDGRAEIGSDLVSFESVNWNTARKKFFLGPRDNADPTTLPTDWR